MIGQVLLALAFVYFIGMIVALAYALVDLEDNAGDHPQQTMSDVAIMCLGYMLTRMILWPGYAALYIRSWLRARVVDQS